MRLKKRTPGIRDKEIPEVGLYVAIVGSEEKYWTEEQKIKVKEKIREIIKLNMITARLDYSCGGFMVVSGACHKGGVDIWTREVCEGMGVHIMEYEPQVYQWEDKIGRYLGNDDGSPWEKKMGYKTRNMEIVHASNVLYDIEPARDNEDGYRRSGGTWTRDYAKKIGRETHMVVIP